MGSASLPRSAEAANAALPATDQVTDSLAETEPSAVAPLSTVAESPLTSRVGETVSTTLTVLVAVPVLPAASVAE